MGRPRDVLLVERAAPVDLAQLEFELDVGFEDFILGRTPNGCPKDLASCLELAPAELKVRRVHPHLGEGEAGMRDDAPAIGEHCAGGCVVLGDKLLEDGVLDPQEDVAPPQALLRDWRNVHHCALVHVAHALLVGRTKRRLKARVIEPVVVLVRLGRHLVLVLGALLVHHYIFDCHPVSVCLLKGDVARAQLLAVLLLEALEADGILVDDARAVILRLALLELGEGHEEGLVDQVLS
mmetsp:Transcript_17897/g.48165  ORF Transcript_17897/g.48165 Transcript_17897/m.48165 type:complete len:237 (-) Transcript_17897:118-828(-)